MGRELVLNFLLLSTLLLSTIASCTVHSSMQRSATEKIEGNTSPMEYFHTSFFFHCTCCINGHFSALSTTSAQTQETAVKTVSDG